MNEKKQSNEEYIPCMTCGDDPSERKNARLCLRLPSGDSALTPFAQAASEGDVLECEIRYRTRKSSGGAWLKARLHIDSRNGDRLLFSADFEDITVGKTAEALRRTRALNRALEASRRDMSTGVYNKLYAEDAIRETLSLRNGSLCLLMIVDIDLLKRVNDTYGHPTGDAVILEIAHALRSQSREGDVVGRIGGDEFMALICDVRSEINARQIVSRLLKGISELSVNGFTPSVSIGCVLTFAGSEDFEALYAKADKALYHVKKNRKSSCDFYSSEKE